MTRAQQRYYDSHREEISRKNSERYLANREKANAQSTEWRKINPEKRREIKRRSYLKHRILCEKEPAPTLEERRAKGRERYAKERATNPERIAERNVQFLIHHPEIRILRCAVRSLKRYRPNGIRRQRSSLYVGCTPGFLHNHLKSLFKTGMTWENFGTAWEIDHVIPLSWFPFDKDPSLLFVASHWSNLQPLWKSDNRSKRNLYFG